MFAASSASSGLDIAIIGSPAPNFTLPDNVHHLHITWNQLVDRVNQRVRGWDENTPDPQNNLLNMKTASPYKVIDFKPMFAYLFPEVVEDYDWWGHCDNDIILGDVMPFLEYKIANFDILSGCSCSYSFGPFTLYRNTPVINELFKLNLPEEVFSHRVTWFDEWGQGSSYGYNASMSGIIDHNRKRLGIRARKGIGTALITDLRCRDAEIANKSKPRCGECTHYRNGTLISRDNPRHKDLVVFMCHYQQGKKTQAFEPSTNDKTKLKSLMGSNQFRVSYDGFDYFEE
jgi:hypothetical protein